MILQNKTDQRNLTANDLVEIKGPHRLHTFNKKVTTIEILVRPGQDVPYVAHIESHGKTKMAIVGMNWSIGDMGLKMDSLEGGSLC